MKKIILLVILFVSIQSIHAKHEVQSNVSKVVLDSYPYLYHVGNKMCYNYYANYTDLDVISKLLKDKTTFRRKESNIGIQVVQTKHTGQDLVLYFFSSSESCVTHALLQRMK